MLCISFFSQSLFALSPTETEQKAKYIRTAFLKVMKKPFTSNAKRKILIIGDSHAQDFYNGIVENNLLNNYEIRTRYIPTRCQIYLADNLTRFTKDADKTLCINSDNLLLAKEQISKANIIILAASWREWSAAALPQTIKNLHLSTNQKLFVVGGKSFGVLTSNNSNNHNLHLRSKVNASQARINHLLKENIDSRIFVNVYQIICGSTQTCPLFTDDLELISLDGGHLTQAGARYIGKKLFKKSSLRHL